MAAIDRGPGAPAEPPGATPDPGPDSAQETPSRRILLVEDHKDALETLARLLAQMNLNVTTAHDGRQACELAFEAHDRGQPYDWILMDMQMPVVDGYEATRRLRARGYDRPIIAMTAYTTDDDRRECLRFGCNDHISKPIDWSLLAAKLQKWLGSEREQK
jgi:CheY-like chemotaxis protein